MTMHHNHMNGMNGSGHDYNSNDCAFGEEETSVTHQTVSHSSSTILPPPREHTMATLRRRAEAAERRARETERQVKAKRAMLTRIQRADERAIAAYNALLEVNDLIRAKYGTR